MPIGVYGIQLCNAYVTELYAVNPCVVGVYGIDVFWHKDCFIYGGGGGSNVRYPLAIGSGFLTLMPQGAPL